jgi:hypothetical protein
LDYAQTFSDVWIIFVRQSTRRNPADPRLQRNVLVVGVVIHLFDYGMFRRSASHNSQEGRTMLWHMIVTVLYTGSPYWVPMADGH